MSDPVTYYVLLGEEQKGPYTLAQLQAMWRDGSLTIDTQYWFEGQTDWMPLGTILELLEPRSSQPHGYGASSPAISLAAKAKPSVGTLLGIGCGVLLVVGLAILLIRLVGSDSNSSLSPNYKNLRSEHSYFDVIRALGSPDKEIEERDAPIPNIVLGYARERWIVYLVYSDRSCDKSKSHYVGIVSTRGTVIHAADVKYRPILESFAYTIAHELR